MREFAGSVVALPIPPSWDLAVARREFGGIGRVLRLQPDPDDGQLQQAVVQLHAKFASMFSRGAARLPSTSPRKITLAGLERVAQRQPKLVAGLAESREFPALLAELWQDPAVRREFGGDRGALSAYLRHDVLRDRRRKHRRRA